MIPDLLLRWIVTALFLLSAAECGYAIATGRRVWTHIVSQVLHLVMALAMVVMAWPWGMTLPTTGPMLFFAVAAVWFFAFTLARSGHRGINAYHAAMMLAMVWMYAVMSGSLLPATSGGTSPAGGPGGHHSMPGMPGMEMPDAADSSGTPPFITGVNWLCAVGFALAVLWWLYRYFGERKAEPSQPSHRFLGTASQAMMAAGMALMFGAML
ncbi:DUF5134 domain-containing protein [Mycobacterium sp. AT1]|uniref:DUF5134 domain-containing protein n=1 Tax=Mycobacterium sp. AT1 TaxID=1961706 RepID=UPI0009AF0924|nr:DUF5134 domain-containing protein [Mycobacterium sp. AT1]OPX13044.1 DUF5134 domain-containing protein [Mycobacterium sp. AT1]